MESPKTLIQAAWVAPIESPIVRDGALVIQSGQIVAVGLASLLRREHPDAVVHDLGNTVILPGLVNAHTHLEHSDRQAGQAPDGTFTDWLLGMRDRPPSPATATPTGIEQCLRFGITCIGDITQNAGITRTIIAQSRLRCVSFGEVLGLGKRRGRFDELLPQALDVAHASSRLRIGLSPHAPYTVDLEGYRRCVQLAKERGLPLATHLAETLDERDFLMSQSGLFRQLWERIGSWEDGVETFQGSPVAMAQAVGMLDYPTLLAHVNYCDDQDLEMLAHGKSSVVYCPRTHRYFGHPRHRWREMLVRGINVAIGTDSCASSPDLNLVDDLRLLRQTAPEIPAETIWKLATIRAARSLGMESDIGSLAINKCADFVAFEASGMNPLEEILRNAALPTSVWIDGLRI